MRGRKVTGAFGGGASQAPAPIEKKDTLFSTQLGRVLDLISEGPIKGFVTGDGRSIYLDETPLLPETYDPSKPGSNPDNAPNFKNVRVAFRSGTPDQDYIPEFTDTERPIAVGVQVKKTKGHDPIPVTRSSTSAGLDAVIVNLKLGPLFKISSDGSIHGDTLRFDILLETNNSGVYTSVWEPPSAWKAAPPPGGWNQYGWLLPGPAPDWDAIMNLLSNATAADFPASSRFSITGKTRGGYGKSIRIKLPPNTESYSLRVIKYSDDPPNSKYGNTLFWESFIEVVEAKFNYPHSAIVGVEVNADQFTSVPKRTYYMDGRIISVPSNRNNEPGAYTVTLSGVTGTFQNGESFTTKPRFQHGWAGNPDKMIGPVAGTVVSVAGNAASLIFVEGEAPIDGVTAITGLDSQAVATLNDPVHAYRSYTGDWDGSFVQAWSDNPAWIVYDMILNDRYGLGPYFDSGNLDRWVLYQIGKYCDELVPDGLGGWEPRFTCNTYIQTRDEAFNLMQQLTSVFRGMAYWAAGFITFAQDRPSNPVHQFTSANVVGGRFTYSGSSRRTRNTIALVRYNNPEDLDKPAVEYVDDPNGLLRYGPVQVELTAFGCRSRGQARRVGYAKILSDNLEIEAIAFQGGRECVYLRPGEVMEIVDPERMAKRAGGRLIAQTLTEITLDREVTIEEGLSYTVHVQMPAITENISAPKNTTTLTLSNLPASLDTTQVAVYADMDNDGEIDLTLNDVRCDIVGFNPTTKVLAIVAPGVTADVITYRVIYNVAFAIVAVTNAAGNTTVLQLAEPLPVMPPASGIWMLVTPNKQPRLFRCVSVAEGDNGAYDVAGTEYIEAKFAQIESQLVLPEPDRAFPSNPMVVSRPGAIQFAPGLSVTPQGIVPVLDLSWAASTGRVLGYDVKWRVNSGNWTRIPRVPGPEAQISPALHGTYDVEVTAAGPGSVSAPSILHFVNDVTIDVSGITGLELEGRGNSDEFGGDDVKLRWNLNIPGLDVEIGNDAAGSENTTFPPWFDGFKVEIWDMPNGTWRLRRSERTWDPSYNYTHEKNHEDSDRLDGPGSSATREGWAFIRSVDTFGNLGTEARKHWINQPPAVPAAEFSVGPSAITVKWPIPADLDLAGIVIWRSVLPEVPTTPENVVYRGSANPVVITAEPGVPYYYRWGLFDGFEIYPTNISAAVLAQIYSPGDPPPPPSGGTIWTQSPDPWVLDENSGWSQGSTGFTPPITYYGLFYLPQVVITLADAESKTITFDMDFALPAALPAGVTLQISAVYGNHLQLGHVSGNSLFPRQPVTLAPDHTAHVQRVGVMTAGYSGSNDYIIEVKIWIWGSWSYEDMTLTNGTLKES